MRARFLFRAISLGSVCGGLAIQACGASSADDTPADAGRVETGTREGAGDDQSDIPTCDVHADFTAHVMDASLADGATTSGACVSCMRTSCAGAVAACNMDCRCQNLAAGVLDCFVRTQLLVCSAPFYLGVIKQGLPSGKALLGCITEDCADACGFADGGVSDASDAADAD
jgi:hypothetical protein